MTLIPTRAPGRHLMVLDDAETIARQARRRAAIRRRRRESLKQVAAVSAVLAVAALVMGVSPMTIGLVTAGLALALGVAYQQVRDHQLQATRRRRRASVGGGIGTPRPKGGFSTTRHRSGAPVWIDKRAA